MVRAANYSKNSSAHSGDKRISSLATHCMQPASAGMLFSNSNPTPALNLPVSLLSPPTLWECLQSQESRPARRSCLYRGVPGGTLEAHRPLQSHKKPKFTASLYPWRAGEAGLRLVESTEPPGLVALFRLTSCLKVGN